MKNINQVSEAIDNSIEQMTRHPSGECLVATRTLSNIKPVALALEKLAEAYGKELMHYRLDTDDDAHQLYQDVEDAYDELQSLLVEE